MKTRPISVLLTLTVLVCTALCGCESALAGLTASKNGNITVTASSDEPLSGMKISEVNFIIEADGKTADNTCEWTIVDNDGNEKTADGVFKSLSTYYATLNFKIPYGVEAENVVFKLKKGAGKLADFNLDSTGEKAQARIVFKIKKLIEISGTVPEADKKAADMDFTVKVDGEDAEFTASWNEHGDRLRQMKPDEVFSSDRVYSLDLSYYIPVGTDYEMLKFGGNMGGGKYDGSGYIEETGELWSHIRFDPADINGICKISIDIDSPKTGDLPSAIGCNVKCNGEKTDCTVFWSGENGEGTILDKDGKFAVQTGILATVRITTDRVFSEGNIIVTAGDSCSVNEKEYVPGDADGESAYISIVLSFNSPDAESDTRNESEAEETEADIRPTNGACAHNYTVVSSVKATCTEDGNKIYQCAYCGISYKETLPKNGHSFAAKGTVQPTCTSDGEQISVCKNCGVTDSKVIPSIPHDIEKVEVKASCTLRGYTKCTCKRCSYSYTENDIAPTGHSYVESIVRERTCAEGGVIKNTCYVCGDTYITEEAATGHNIQSWTHNYNTAVHSGTCSTCGETVTETHAFDYTYIDDTRHSFACPVCGLTGKEAHKKDSCALCH